MTFSIGYDPLPCPSPPLLCFFWSNSDLSIADWLLTNKSPYRVDTCVKAFWRPFWATFFAVIVLAPKAHTHSSSRFKFNTKSCVAAFTNVFIINLRDYDSITITIFICNFCSVFIFIFISYVSNFTCSNFKVSMKLTIVIWCCSWRRWWWWWARRWRWRRRRCCYCWWCYRKPKPSSILTLINSSKPQRGEFAKEKKKQFQFRFQFDFLG